MRGGPVAVDVEDPDQPSARAEHRQDDLGPGRGSAGDMAWECVHVRDQLHLPRPRRRPAHPARERDDQAAMPALIGSDLQKFGSDHPVETGPVEPVVGMVHLAGDGGHQRHLVGFALRQAADRRTKRLVVHPRPLVGRARNRPGSTGS